MIFNPQVSGGGGNLVSTMGVFSYPMGGGSYMLDAPCKLLRGMWGGAASNNIGVSDMFSLRPGQSFTLDMGDVEQTLTFSLNAQKIIVSDPGFLVEGEIYYYAIS